MLVLNYSKMGLMFNLDLLGYDLMALSTFFIGFTINVKNKKDNSYQLLYYQHYTLKKTNKRIKFNSIYKLILYDK